jgi:hypothetical protein
MDYNTSLALYEKGCRCERTVLPAQSERSDAAKRREAVWAAYTNQIASLRSIGAGFTGFGAGSARPG